MLLNNNAINPYWEKLPLDIAQKLIQKFEGKIQGNKVLLTTSIMLKLSKPS